MIRTHTLKVMLFSFFGNTDMKKLVYRIVRFVNGVLKSDRITDDSQISMYTYSGNNDNAKSCVWLQVL